MNNYFYTDAFRGFIPIKESEIKLVFKKYGEKFIAHKKDDGREIPHYVITEARSGFSVCHQRFYDESLSGVIIRSKEILSKKGFIRVKLAIRKAIKKNKKAGLI